MSSFQTPNTIYDNCENIRRIWQNNLDLHIDSWVVDSVQFDLQEELSENIHTMRYIISAVLHLSVNKKWV